jgi:SOS-response transcriptional repressor LexA
MEIPLLSCRISAGFPSPADDYIEAELDLNRYMIRNPPDTFRVTNEALAGAGILDGDVLIVDRSIGLSRCDCRRDGEWGDVRSASEQKEWKLGP